jgi:small subunit ribosomal protein S9
MPTTAEKRYVEGIGRRKTSTARVRLYLGSKKGFAVNGKTLDAYFPTAEMKNLIEQPFKTAAGKTFEVSARVLGGGIHSQAEAVRMGIARALAKLEPELRKPLKKEKLLVRDARIKERRKFGLKKARKAPQWSKR